jgi:hypothetical protein
VLLGVAGSYLPTPSRTRCRRGGLELSNRALIGCVSLCDLRTNPVPIGPIENSASDTFVYCIDGTFCVAAINEINCCAAPRALENADENDVADPDACGRRY